jgi:hypothetical protein
MSPRLAASIALIVAAVAVAGCGGGGNVPSSVRSSLPGSLPTSVPTSLPTSTPTGTGTTTTTPPPTTTTAPPTTTTPPPTTTTTTTTITTSTPTSTSAPSSTSDTPWGWIAAIAILLVIAVLIAGWAIGRRGGSRKSWQAQVGQVGADGAALHDAALGELIAATQANRPERWAAIATGADTLAASLRQLEASSPGEEATRVTQGAISAAAAARSAVAIAGSAPAGLPLDEEAARTLRERLEQLAAASRDLATYARNG